ncbi:Protein slit [Halotydeus destructor]|nr:Protein slit [Halotydeus destructor]
MNIQVSCVDQHSTTVRNVLKNMTMVTTSNSTPEVVFDHLIVIGMLMEDGLIDNDFLKGLTIKSVSIVRSGVRTFGPLAFRRVTGHLDLSYNSIKALPKQLDLLVRKVNLSHNQLEQIGSDSFSSQTVDLSHNKIKLIRKNAFKADSTLNINLDHNQLTSFSFEPEFIKSLSVTLSVNLFLNGNSISYLDQSVFAELIKSTLSSVTLADNPISCDCKSRWLISLKRFDQSWTNLYPRIEEATCQDGSDLIKDVSLSQLAHCVDDIFRPDVAILSPCRIISDEHLRCYRVNYEDLSTSLTPISRLMSQPLDFDKLSLDKVVFKLPEAKLDDLLEFIRIKELKISSTNCRLIATDAFSSSAYSMTSLDLKGKLI